VQSKANSAKLTFARYALNRIAFGPRPGDTESLVLRGLREWVDEQLAPNDAYDGDCRDRLKALRLRIRYPAGVGYPAVDEERPLVMLDAPLAAIWHLNDPKVAIDSAERQRPREEVIAATIVRAVYSRWQLREVLVGFWHDHFSVDAYGTDAVAIALPAYDRNAIRQQSLGNFRTLLELVASSPAMLYYLSNRDSRAGAANENYARELFELHTLGRSAYLNDRYLRWRDVPGAGLGKPSGYIDEDVYEAARAFTGWTTGDGEYIEEGRRTPQTGEFAYVGTWHDGYQKRILGVDFDPFQGPLADGRRVLDLVAKHPATAKFICQKLCRRLVGEPVPTSLVARACVTFAQHIEAPDQIARVVRVILLSQEFAECRAKKIRRPFGLLAAFARATALNLVPRDELWKELAAAGQPLFGWDSPTGPPEEGASFLSTQSMRHRWNLVLCLAENTWQSGALPGPETHGLSWSNGSRDAARSWLYWLNGNADESTIEILVECVGGYGSLREVGEHVRCWSRLAALAAMTPAFQSV
jgi:uncharacterized protein (DUF1800 family)